MFTLRHSRKQSGFTLLELLVVAAILGALLFMVVPRLGGVTDNATTAIRDTNLNNLLYVTHKYYDETGTLPNGLTNLVDLKHTADGGPGYEFSSGGRTYRIPENLPSVENSAVAGAEVLSQDFYLRNVPGVWKLSAEGAAELKAMGITKVYNLIGKTGIMEEQAIKKNVPVMLFGLQYADTMSKLTFEAGYPLLHPEWFGRILMGVNDQCDLVTGGMIQSSALCPSAVLHKENFTFKEYILVLPRLHATVSYISGGWMNSKVLEDILFSDTPDSPEGHTMPLVWEGQYPWDVTISSPEGYGCVRNDARTWVLGTINGGTLDPLGGTSPYYLKPN